MTRGIGRNISASGLFVETREPLPLGGQCRVTFASDEGNEMTALCEVRYQVALNYAAIDGQKNTSSRGVGLRIIAYETKEDHPLLLVDRERVLH